VKLTRVHRLILLYAFLTALTFPYIAFASDVSFGDADQTVFGLVVWTLIVWRLWRRSSTAWFVALALDVLMILTLFLMQPGLGLTPLVLFVIASAHLVILVSHPMRAHVRLRSTRLASS
jgi:hypothetical protein